MAIWWIFSHMHHHFSLNFDAGRRRIQSPVDPTLFSANDLQGSRAQKAGDRTGNLRQIYWLYSPCGAGHPQRISGAMVKEKVKFFSSNTKPSKGLGPQALEPIPF